MNDQLFGALSALLGALIGGGMPILANFIQEKYQRSKRAEIASRAVAGEIAAVIQVFDRRNFIEELRRAATATKDIEIFRWRVSREYFQVTQGCVSDWGMLPGALPNLIPRMLTIFNAALEDFDEMYQGKWDGATPERLRELYNKLAELLEIARTVAIDIVGIVDKQYPAVGKLS